MGLLCFIMRCYAFHIHYYLMDDGDDNDCCIGLVFIDFGVRVLLVLEPIKVTKKKWFS